MSDDERSEDHQKQGRPSVISAKTVNTSVRAIVRAQPALTASDQCSIETSRNANGAFSLSETIDLLDLFARSSPEFYT